jgi:molecular chaperone GrpE
MAATRKKTERDTRHKKDENMKIQIKQEETGTEERSDRNETTMAEAITDLESRLEDLECARQELEAEIEGLRAELESAQAKSQEYLDGWQRALADFTNYKRRIERDQQLTYQNQIGSVVKRYLPIVDDLERALNNRPLEGEGAAWAGGIELIYRKFLTALEADGVRQMEVAGQMFDPNLHEAISQAPSSEHESGQVTEVLQKGYLIGDRVLRPAIVKVAE